MSNFLSLDLSEVYDSFSKFVVVKKRDLLQWEFVLGSLLQLNMKQANFLSEEISTDLLTINRMVEDLLKYFESFSITKNKFTSEEVNSILVSGNKIIKDLVATKKIDQDNLWISKITYSNIKNYYIELDYVTFLHAYLKYHCILSSSYLSLDDFDYVYLNEQFSLLKSNEDFTSIIYYLSGFYNLCTDYFTMPLTLKSGIVNYNKFSLFNLDLF